MLIKSNENNAIPLTEYVGNQLIGLITSYTHKNVVIEISKIKIKDKNKLIITTELNPKFKKGDKVTVHLDSRNDIDIIDARFDIYRLSYKGLISEVKNHSYLIEPIEYVIAYGYDPIEQFLKTSYKYPTDEREAKPLPISDLKSPVKASSTNNEENLGILVTKGIYHPHTSIMSYLMLEDESLILLSSDSTFKSKLLFKDNECWYSIDKRSIENSLENRNYNYFTKKYKVFEIPKEKQVFKEVKHLFITKNPFESPFFYENKIRMLHLKPIK